MMARDLLTVEVTLNHRGRGEGKASMIMVGGLLLPDLINLDHQMSTLLKKFGHFTVIVCVCASPSDNKQSFHALLNAITSAPQKKVRA